MSVEKSESAFGILIYFYENNELKVMFMSAFSTLVL